MWLEVSIPLVPKAAANTRKLKSKAQASETEKEVLVIVNLLIFNLVP